MSYKDRFAEESLTVYKLLLFRCNDKDFGMDNGKGNDNGNGKGNGGNFQHGSVFMTIILGVISKFI